MSNVDDLSTKKLKEKIRIWVEHPEIFDLEVYDWDGNESPTPQQIDGFKKVAALANAKFKVNSGMPVTPKERELAKKLGISIRSGHGTGKTAFLARLYYWLMFCFPNACGYVTASTSTQLETVLWKEFYKWRNKSPLLQKFFQIQSDKVFHIENPKMCFVQGRTTNMRATEQEQGETLAGLHSDYMILAADEASNLPYGVFKPLEGVCTGLMNFVVLISNPTRGHGFFFDSHNKEANKWITLHWNAEESPLVSKELLENDKQRYGADSNWYRIRRKGDFPLQEGDTLIPYEWVTSAINRPIEVIQHDYILKGLDVGAGGDETVILTRKGHKVTNIVTKNEPDTEKLKSWIFTELSEEPDKFIVFLDPIGVGNHIYYWLSRINIPNMVQVYAVDVRCESSSPQYFRLRDELIMKMREDFEKRTISIPDDDELVSELTTIKSDDPDSTKGKIKIESKKSMRIRGIASPNKLDALALTYYFDDKYYYSLVNSDKTKKKKKLQYYNWKVL